MDEQGEGEKLPERKPGESVVVELRVPVQLGKDTEPITQLELKPISRALRELQITVTKDGGVVYHAYNLAKTGARMAGQLDALVDKLDPRDLAELSRAVLSFLQ